MSAHFLFSDLFSFHSQSKVAAVPAAPQRLCPMPYQFRVHIVISNIITVAKAGAQLRAAVPHAGFMVRAFHHINPHE